MYANIYWSMTALSTGAIVDDGVFGGVIATFAVTGLMGLVFFGLCMTYARKSDAENGNSRKKCDEPARDLEPVLRSLGMV